MISEKDAQYLEGESNSEKYRENRFIPLKNVYLNPEYRGRFTIKTPEKVKRIHDGDVVWVDSPEKDRASVGLIYVQTLDGQLYSADDKPSK